MKRRYLSFVWLLWISCASKSDPAQKTIVGTEVPKRALKPSPCPPCNSVNPDYVLLKKHFYKDKMGEVYEVKYEDNPFDSCCPMRMVLDERFGVSTDDVRKTLKEVIDFQTYETLEPSIYAKDKKWVYVFRDNSNGGFRTILEGANPATFRNIDSTFFWGMDQQHVFYRGTLIEGLRSKNLKVLRMVLSNPESTEQIRIVRGRPNYVKNETQVFYQEKEVVKADAPSFRVVDSNHFDAVDKYRRYQDGRAVH